MHLFKSIAFLVISLAAGAAQGGLVTVPFSGRMDDAFGTIPVGTTFSGSITYAYPQVGTGNYALQNMTLNIASRSISINGGTIVVFDDGTGFPDDYFEADAQPATETILGGMKLNNIAFVLQDMTGTVFSSRALPPALNLASFSHEPGPGNPSFLQLSGSPADQAFDSQIARGRLNPTPEPSTLLGAAVASVALVVAGRRRPR